MYIGKIKTFLSSSKETLPGRWFWLFLGLGLIVYGQTLMHLREQSGDANPKLEVWNIFFNLEIVNMQNLGMAIPYLLVGGVLSALAFLPNWNRDDELQATTANKAKFNWPYIFPRLTTLVVLFTFLMLKLSRHEYTLVMPWVWLIVLALLTDLFYRHEKSAGLNLSLNITRLDSLLMIALFLGGLLIGAFALQDIPNIMVPDEGSFWENGRAIAIGEYKPVFFNFGVYTFPIASTIFQGWVMRVFGINVWGWRFASVLAGTLTVIPLYFLAREWFDRRVAVMAGLFMISSPYYLSFARLGYNNSQALFPTVLSLYFWSVGFKRKSNLFYCLAGLAAGLGFYTYTAAWLGLVTILLLMVLLLLIRRNNFRHALLATVIFLIAATLTAAPRLVYGASSEDAQPLYYKLAETSFINEFYGSVYYSPAELHPDGGTYLFGGNKVFFVPRIYAELLTRGIVRTLAALFNPFIVTEHFITTNLAGGFFSAVCLMLGLALSLRNVEQTRFILLLTWFLAGLFFLSCIAAFPPRQTHLVTILPVLALFPAIGLAALIDTFVSELQQKRAWKPTLAAWVQKGLLVSLSAALVFSGLREYFTTMPTRNPPLFEDIVSWIAWRTEEPHSIAYISPEDGPHRVEYTIYSHMAPHSYIYLIPGEFNWANFSENSIVFLDGKENNLPEPPSTFYNSATYTNQNGEITGYAWSNTGIDLQPLAPFPITFPETPNTIIALLAALVLILILLMTLRFRVRIERIAGQSGFRIYTEVSLRKVFKKVANEGS